MGLSSIFNDVVHNISSITYCSIGYSVILNVLADTFELETLREPILGRLPSVRAVSITKVLAAAGSYPLDYV